MRETIAMADETVEYVGFWARVGASMIDTVLALLSLVPVTTLVYGRQYWQSTALVQGPLDFLLNWVLPAVAVILFWIYRQATPGKIAIGACIIDAKTGGRPSTGQLIVGDVTDLAFKAPGTYYDKYPS
jgi:uncharacterized RDD family membrane protein YckC